MKNVAVGKAKGRHAKVREAMALRLEKAERKHDELTKTQAKQVAQINNTIDELEEIWI